MMNSLFRLVCVEKILSRLKSLDSGETAYYSVS
jgi:hypothetical protein